MHPSNINTYHKTKIMTYLKNRTKPVLTGIILLAFSLTVILFSCRKNNDAPPENSFNAGAAKEWFYATFKKTNEYATAATAGKQLPKWETGRYKKTGNIEMVEYDLVQQKKTTMVVPTGNPFEDKRIADAAINRALFVKKDGQTRLFNLQLIPGADYAKAKHYDISANGFVNPDKNFTGKLLIKNWNNELVKGYNITEGKKTGIIKPVKQGNAAGRSANSECEDIYHYLLVQWCDYEPVGDNITLVSCGDWSILSETMTASNCPMSGSECDQVGIDQEACLCQMLGICGGGGGEDELPCASLNLDDMLESASTQPVMLPSVTTQIDDHTAKREIDWQVFYVQNAFGYTRVSSHENAYLKYSDFNHRWEFETIVHDSTLNVESDLSIYDCDPRTISFSTIYGNTWIFNYTHLAKMRLKFNVKLYMTCLFTVKISQKSYEAESLPIYAGL